MIDQNPDERDQTLAFDSKRTAALPSGGDRRKWVALALLCVAMFVVILDASIINVALPTIGRSLKFSQADLPWVVNAYVLTFGGCLLLGGRVADLLGRRRVFMGGLILFAVASFMGGFAQSEAWLLAARAAQGVGAAILSPSALSLLTVTFSDGAERNRALGTWSAVAGSAGAVGVLLGGVLTTYVGWEWVLWVNVPIGIVSAAFAPMLIGESRSDSATRAFDIAGALSVTGGLSVLVYAFINAGQVGWASAQTAGLLAISAVLLGAFVIVELRSAAPLVPFRIFRRRTLTGANVVTILIGASLLSMFLLMSLYMQQVLGYSAIRAGLSYVPHALTVIVASAVASQLVTKVGFKPVLSAGMVVLAGGLVWFGHVSTHGTFVGDVLGPSVLAGVGVGLAFVPATIAAVTGVAEHEAGLASGLVNSSLQVGAALGISVLATLATTRSDALLASAHGNPAALPDALTQGFQVAFLGGAVIAILGFLATLVLIRGRDSRAHVELARVAGKR